MDGGLGAGGRIMWWVDIGGIWGGWREDIVDVDRGWTLAALGVRMSERRE